jgi:pimeloyl-ACP methyl ester carboxylesterase
MTPLIRTIFKTASGISPALAGAMAHKLFSTPLKVGRLSAAEKRLVARAEAKLATAEHIAIATDKHSIAAYRFGAKKDESSKRIILVHGWMSGARFMLAIMDRLVSLGHEVICFDLPAHGSSSGKSTNLIECAEALKSVISHFGPVDRIIAHSFGGAVTAYALSRASKPVLINGGEVILLASPNRLTEVTRHFSKAMGISDKGRLAFEKRLCAPMGGDIRTMDGNLMYAAAGFPLHVIHCKDDAEVSVEEGQRFAELEQQVHYVELSGLGHRRILYAEPALDAIALAV